MLNDPKVGKAIPALRRLSQAQIEQIQQWRFEDVPVPEILKRIPEATEGLIAAYAPSELRGKRRRLAQYINDHPGVDYNEIPFRQVDVAPHDAAAHLYFLRKANLITFAERKALNVNGHGQAGSSGEKGIFDIRITNIGKKRLTPASKIKGTGAFSKTHSNAHRSIAQKAGMEIRPLPSNILDQPTTTGISRLIPPEELVERTPEPVVPPVVITQEEEFVSTIPQPQGFPLLDILRKREAQVHAANRLAQQAANLYGEAGMDNEGVLVLEHIAKATPKFSALEVEYLRFADERGD